MKIKFNFNQDSVIPKQFLAPNFYLNNSNDHFFQNQKNGYIGELLDVNRINFFVGANNSGKSRFLRGIYNTEYLFYEVYLNNSIDSLIHEIRNHEIFSYEPIDPAEYVLLEKLQPKFIEFVEKIEIKNENGLFYQQLLDYNKSKKYYKEFLDTKIEFEFLKANLQQIVTDFFVKIQNINEAFIFWSENQASEKIYIPILRSLLQCEHLDASQYIEMSKSFFEIKMDGLQKIHTGLEMYNSVESIHNSSKIRDLREFCTFVGKNFFNGAKIELLPDKLNGGILLFSINDEEIRGINFIGDGLQALLIILYPIYTSSEKSWFFIEEPETHLHPGLQRVLIETLLNDAYLKSKKLRYFFTTHSNHFLDTTLNSDEISIFQFQKISENEHLIKTKIKPSKEILDILGVNTSSVFLANTSLWVEGPTDRKYISKFLKLYCEYSKCQYLKEDIDFAFFEYGGNLIAHYLFDEEKYEGDEDLVRDKINSFASANKIYLLADEDDAKGNTEKGKRRIALQKLSDKLNNFLYQNTELREIENLLPNTIIRSFMTSIVDNEAAEKVKKIDFKKAEYNKLRLGSFYEKQFLDNSIPKKNQKSFRAESGTLKNDYKIRLCENFINSDITYLELIEDNPILEKIIKALYNFIIKK